MYTPGTVDYKKDLLTQKVAGHIILFACGGKLRTISMDTWAALEHHLKYKKSVGSRAALIEEELKRCADELASTDLSMQTIRDMILEA